MPSFPFLRRDQLREGKRKARMKIWRIQLYWLPIRCRKCRKKNAEHDFIMRICWWLHNRTPSVLHRREVSIIGFGKMLKGHKPGILISLIESSHPKTHEIFSILDAYSYTIFFSSRCCCCVFSPISVWPSANSGWKVISVATHHQIN